MGLQAAADDGDDDLVCGDDLLGLEPRHLEIAPDRRRWSGLLRVSWHGRRPVERTLPGRAVGMWDQPGREPGVIGGRSRSLEIRLSGMREAFSRLRVTLVGQPVQGRSRQPLAPQHLRPLLERQVRRHDHARPLIRRADHVEQQLRPDLARRHISQLVQHQQVELRQLRLQPATIAAPRGPPAAAWPAPSPGRTAPACPGRTPRSPAPWPGASSPCRCPPISRMFSRRSM